MKIITKDAAYVQKNDITFLNNTDIPIPASIFLKMFGTGVVIIDDSNRYEFMKYEEKDEIEFFKNLDWIIDYNEVKDLTEEEFIKFGQSIADEKNAIAKKFNAMSNEEKENNMNMVSECELLDFKMYSLRDILWFKQGHLKMTLPKIEESYIETNEPTDNSKGIKKLVKTIFKKKN